MGTTGIAPDNELEQRYIRYKDVIKELTIMNDIFMRNVLKKRECAEYILRIIMEGPAGCGSHCPEGLQESTGQISNS